MNQPAPEGGTIIDGQGLDGSVVSITPPLCIESDILEDALRRLAEGFS